MTTLQEQFEKVYGKEEYDNHLAELKLECGVARRVISHKLSGELTEEDKDILRKDGTSELALTELINGPDFVEWWNELVKEMDTNYETWLKGIKKLSLICEIFDREDSFWGGGPGLASRIERKETKNYTNYDLDLKNKFPNLEELNVNWSKLSSLNLSECRNLIRIELQSNNLTSVDFLNQLPNPEKLTYLRINNNNIQPTDISIFSKFVNLEGLFIGTDFLERKSIFSGFSHTYVSKINETHYNRFYGSLKSLRNLTKLKELCIANNNVDEGLEYLPESLSVSIKNDEEIIKQYDEWQTRNLRQFLVFDCQAQNPNVKCKAIQDQLRPYNYDLEAWQLAHPHKMYKVRPELFESPESREKWLNAIIAKIASSENKLSEIKQNEPDKVKKIKHQKNEWN